MGLAPPTLDYSDKDYDALRFRLRNLVRSVFPEWTDFNVTNFGNILLELFAHTGDILTFYQDNQARQSRITSVTQRSALLGLVKLIGFTPATATAASADLTITLPTPPVGVVTFPKGTVVSTLSITSPIAYQLLADAVIPAGANPAMVVARAENSVPADDTFFSTGLPNQAFTLATTPYIDGTLILSAANGSYTQVGNFLDSTPSDRHYTIAVDQNDRAIVTFGNGINGSIPVSTITAVYRTGGGAVGRVQQNTLTVFAHSTWSDAFGNEVVPSVTNLSISSGGTDRQSVAQIKQRAPATLRANNRTVSREDFEINALRLSSVARALMLTQNEDPAVGENTGELYVIPVGGGVPSVVLKAAVFNQVTVVYPCTLTFDVHVDDPAYCVVNVSATVFFRSGVVKATAASAIRANLTAFFAPQNTDGTANTQIDFGANIKGSDGSISGELAMSDVLNVVRDTTGVRKVGPNDADFLLNGVHDDIVLAYKEFPQLGTITLIDGDTATTI